MIFALGALIIVFIVCRVVPNVFFLFIPVILLQEYLFCLGLGMLQHRDVYSSVISSIFTMQY